MNFDDIVFDNDSHSYSYGDQPLTAVTTVKKRLLQPFDKDEVSRIVAEREGPTQAEVIEKWEKKGKASRDKGTRLHQYIEDIMRGKIDSIARAINDRIPEMDAFDIAWQLLRSKLDAKLVNFEWTVGDAEWGIAGRVDVVLDLCENGKRVKRIVDWKTGKFDTKNQFSRLLSPLHAYDGSKWSEYSIQLNFYRLIIEKNLGEQFGDGYILHLDCDGKYNIYRSKDSRKELTVWLNAGNARFNPERDKYLEQLITVLNKVDVSFLNEASPNIVKMAHKSLMRSAHLMESALLEND